MTATQAPRPEPDAQAQQQAERQGFVHLANVVRGGLIGTVEVVPGVSGGTVALVTGLYEQIITSAGHVLTGLRLLVTDPLRGRGAAGGLAELRRARWSMLTMVGLGMVAGLLLTASFIESMLADFPRQTHALFFGLVLASAWVPFSLSGGRWRLREYATAGLAATWAFVLTGLPPAEMTPSPPIVAVAASFAVCALVLPGVSGSFLLLTVGLYEPTLDAVNSRDAGYLATFAAGAVVGLALFVKVLQWLLSHRRRITLVVMTGLMLGALRALWPWQGDDRQLLAPAGQVASVALFCVLGLVAVAVVIAIEQLIRRRKA